MLLVDTNVLLDVFQGDPRWFEWSAWQIRHQRQVHELCINPVVYAELAPSFKSEQALDFHLDDLELRYREPSRTVMFIAGMAHRYYRRNGGSRKAILPDFFLGAHAAVLGCGILTRDARPYQTYFPAVPLIAPEVAAGPPT